ncbi:arylesterase [Sphingobacterium humi]|nr:arylesterase [Sphingobacterium humi]
MESPQPASKQNILFFGNSLTAGLGLESQQDAFPALIQGKIDSAGLQYQCINAGLSGETSAGGKERIDWLLKDSVAIFVLELGANDGLRGIAPAATYSNLAAIVDKVKKAYPDCKLVLAGMKVPPSMGDNYFKDFEAIFPKLAKEKNMTLVPFLLDKVAGNSSLNQQDGVHPTKEGQLILAHNVWSQLKEVL